MRRFGTRLYHRLSLGFCLAIVVGSLISWSVIERQLESALRQRIREDLLHKIYLVEALVGPFFDAEEPSGGRNWQQVMRQLGQRLPQRITLIAANGTVLADSDESLEVIGNHADRPEMIDSLRAPDGIAESARWSVTVGNELQYAALAIRRDGVHQGWVRLAVPLDFIHQQRRVLRIGLGLGVGVAAVVALAVGMAIARGVSRPLERLTNAAVSVGHAAQPSRMPTQDLPVNRQDEIGALARSFVAMTEELARRFDIMAGDRNKLLAVLAAMQEGVIAIDDFWRILHINRAACQLLDLVGIDDQTDLTALDLPDTLTDAFRSCLSSNDAQRRELQLTGRGRGQTLLLHAAPLRNGGGRPVGAVMVLTDQTERQKLDDMRRDFIANVSHELKTPLTVIQGILETIADDETMPATMQHRFIAKAQDHTRRLGTLVSDLLVLSRLESPDRVRDWERFDLRQVLRSAVAGLRETALGQGITLELETLDDALPVNGDAEAVGQVFDNLLSNAVRYSHPQTEVRVRGRCEGAVIIAEVADQGIGIPSKAQERIFERFYRVDKARSREVGGTGLGLAIVRHVVLSHGGTVAVESEPGQGSVFIVRLPRAPDPA